jgi:hypothetical protein
VKLASDGFPPLWMRFEKFTNNLKCGFDGKSEREREREERGRVCKTKLTDKTGAQLLAGGLIYI